MREAVPKDVPPNFIIRSGFFTRFLKFDRDRMELREIVRIDISAARMSIGHNAFFLSFGLNMGNFLTKAQPATTVAYCGRNPLIRWGLSLSGLW